MIGFYNYSVILTYIGLTSAVIGMMEAGKGEYKLAMLCLIIAGICDMFDGNIARRMKNRTEQEKVFGIQIDSLCDLVCFGVFPAAVTYSIAAGTCRILGIAAAVLYTLAAVIRLAYFNVMEQERQKQTKEKRKYYQGLPVTSASMIFPTIYIGRELLGSIVYAYAFPVVMIIVAVLFITDFKFRKPGKVASVVMAVYGVLELLGVLFV